MHAELLQPSHVEAKQLGAANSIKELCTKIAIRCAAFEHVVDDGQ